MPPVDYKSTKALFVDTFESPKNCQKVTFWNVCGVRLNAALNTARDAVRTLWQPRSTWMDSTLFILKIPWQSFVVCLTSTLKFHRWKENEWPHEWPHVSWFKIHYFGWCIIGVWCHQGPISWPCLPPNSAPAITVLCLQGKRRNSVLASCVSEECLVTLVRWLNEKIAVTRWIKAPNPAHPS